MVFVDFADEFDQRMVEHWLDRRFEIFEIGVVHFCGDAQFHARQPGDFDGAVRPLLRRNAAKKGQIVATPGLEGTNSGSEPSV